MGGKGKGVERPSLVDQHFTKDQRACFPTSAWEYLETMAGDEDNALRLTKKQLRDYAGDFLDFDEGGRQYFPLSTLGQWQYEFSHADTKKYITEVMTTEKQRRQLDLGLGSATPESSKIPTTPSPSKARKSLGLGITASRTPPAKEASEQRTATRARNKTAVAESPDRRAKSPTLALDVPFDDFLDQAVLTPRKSILPTSESIEIAAEKFSEPGIHETRNTSRGQSRSTTQGFGGSKSPTTPRKRPIEEVSGERPSSSSTFSPSVRPNKRTFVDALFEQDDEPSSSTPILPHTPPPVELSALDTLMPPPKRVRGDSIKDIDQNQTSLGSNIVTTYGLPFSHENLSKIPDRVLGYVSDCIDHQIRLANGAENETLRNEHRSHSTLFRKMHADLESRIKCLAEDAEAKGRVESSHCLWG